MKKIDETERRLAKRATVFSSGGFRPTNSDTELR